MSTFYGISANTSSSFFNSFFGNSSTGNSSVGGNSSMLTDYYAIKNGSYKKLLKAYYASEDVKTDSTKKDNTTATEKANLTTTKSNAKELVDSAGELLESGTKSIFNKINIKDEETGKITRGYDVDKIYDGVKKFVDNYNKVVNTAGDVDTESVLKKTLWMVNDTKVYESALNKMGITIGADNTLSIDEIKFKAADMTEVKNLFNTNTSFAAKTLNKASDIYNLSNTALNNGNMYNNSAKYSTLSTGQLYDSLF